MNWASLSIVFGFSLVVFSFVMIGMAIGYIVSKKRLEGSCGGIASQSSDSGAAKCNLCENSASLCDLLARKKTANTKTGSEVM
jgi:hypothetical protein